MFIRLLAVFIIIPLVELIILIKVGSYIGLWPTILIVVLTGVVGAALARYQGFLIINKIRAEKSEELIKEGMEPLDRYEFDYLLLCNKICGKSHYNMQMKIIVETEEEYNAWMESQQTFSQTIASMQ